MVDPSTSIVPSRSVIAFGRYAAKIPSRSDRSGAAAGRGPPDRRGRHGRGLYLADVPVAEGLSKRVVIKKIRKELADQPEFTRMFVDEAKIALGLNHANIVQVFDFGQVHGSFYLAMELVEGQDLMRLVHTIRGHGERVPVVIAAYIAHQVAPASPTRTCAATTSAAPLGIVHRDISPHNIMLSLAGTVKILDFGIARTAAPAARRERRPRTGPSATITPT
jgi:serine/threonine protein kinase